MRTVFVADVHGCLTELRALVDRLSPRPEDVLVFLGDLVDRGPDPVGVVRFVRTFTGCTVRGILGNHEEKALRWLRHEDKVAAGQQSKNPMKPVPPVREAQWRALDVDDRAYLASLPLALEADVGGQPWVAVHGGLLPGRPLGDQILKHASEIVRCRWVDAEGKHVGMKGGSKEMPEGAFPWMERFDGAFNVVCGHAVHGAVEIKRALDAGEVPKVGPRVDKTVSGYEVWSLDTGCFGGGSLTALVLNHDRPDQREVVQVPSLKVYFPFSRDGSAADDS
jgi:bis(5'-nucleosyl)-tetraphosphatase (symmetrical)